MSALPPRLRQSEILALIGLGLTEREIAEVTGIKLRTVRYHTRKLRREHGVQHNRQLIPIAQRSTACDK